MGEQVNAQGLQANWRGGGYVADRSLSMTSEESVAMDKGENGSEKTKSQTVMLKLNARST